ncbi:MAG: hypothetical protein ACLTMP_06580 [Eggerthella lenta]
MDAAKGVLLTTGSYRATPDAAAADGRPLRHAATARRTAWANQAGMWAGAQDNIGAPMIFDRARLRENAGIISGPARRLRSWARQAVVLGSQPLMASPATASAS